MICVLISKVLQMYEVLLVRFKLAQRTQFFRRNVFCSTEIMQCKHKYDHENCMHEMDDNAKGGLTQFWDLLTVTLCAPKDFKRQ